MQEVRNKSIDFGVAVADTLLARDQLQASIRWSQGLGAFIPSVNLSGA